MDDSTTRSSGRRGRRARVWPAGVCALGAAVVAAVVIAIDGSGAISTAFTEPAPRAVTVYGVGSLLLAVALGVSGLLVLVVRHRVAVTALVGVAGLCAAQLAGTGLVARRRWPLYWGCCAEDAITARELVRGLALGMAVVCALAAVVCLVVLVGGRFLRRPGADLRTVVAFATALVVALLGPSLADPGYGHDVAAWSLMYGVPFAVALALTALVPRGAGLSLAAGVAASALAAQAGASYLELRQPWDGALLLVLLASAVAAGGLLLPAGTSVAGRLVRAGTALTATRAGAEDLQRVADVGVAVLVGDGAGPALDGRALDLDRRAAARGRRGGGGACPSSGGRSPRRPRCAACRPRRRRRAAAGCGRPSPARPARRCAPSSSWISWAERKSSKPASASATARRCRVGPAAPGRGGVSARHSALRAVACRWPSWT